MKRKILSVFLLASSILFVSCSKNLFEFMHSDDATEGNDLVVAAENYMNKGENTKASEYFKKGIEQTDGEWKARAIAGYLSAQFNLIYGENGVFILRAGIALAKMADNPNTTNISILSKSIWQAIKAKDTEITNALFYTKLNSLNGYEKSVQDKINQYKLNAAILKVFGTMATMAMALDALGLFDTSNLSNLKAGDLSGADKSTLVQTVASASGVDSNNITLAQSVTGDNSGILFKFTKFPYDVSTSVKYAYTEERWNKIKTYIINNPPLILSDSDANSVPDNLTNGLDISQNNSIVDNSSIQFLVDGTKPDADKEIWKSSVTGEYYIFANSEIDADLLKDLMKANANGGTGMDPIQEQVMNSMISSLYK